MPLPVSFTLPFVDVIETSPSAVIAIVSSLLETTIVLFPLLSTISIVSSPSLSLRTIVWPLRDLITRRSFLPSSFVRNGGSTPFQSAPSTYGKRGSPCSKPTSTSSSTSGRKKQPRSLPAIGAAIRAHQLSSVSESHGNLTLTRPS